MNFTLKLVFSGPCVYVPAADNGKLTILVVDASRPEEGSEQRIHLPAILFDLDDLESTQNVNMVRFEGKDGRRRGAVFLEREEIAIAGTAKEQPLQFLSVAETLPDPKKTERFGFEFIPKLETALPGSGVVDSAALDEDDPPFTVAVRARLTQGEVYTARMSLEHGLTYTEWAFVPPDMVPTASDRVHIIGLDAGIDLRIENRASLVLSRFGPGNQSRALHFKPAIGHTQVCVEVANSEPARLFDVAPMSLQVPDQDPDFAYNYRISSNPAINSVPKPIPKASGGATLGGTTCGGGIGEEGGG